MAKEIEYIHFNILGQALSDMATQSGSLGERLASVYETHLKKINWNKDLQVIPDSNKENFLLLKTILFDDIDEAVQKQRVQYKNEYYLLSDDDLKQMSNSKTVIKGLHWRKLKKAAKLISELYFSIGLSVADLNNT